MSDNELLLHSEIMKNMAEGVYLVGADDGVIKYCNPKKEKELAKKMRDLEIFHKVAVGRELKMEELKARIAELEAKLHG